MIAPWNLSVVQSNCKPVFKRGSGFRKDALQENLDHVTDLMLGNYRGNSTGLFLFSEFFLHGFTAGRSVDEWIEASVEFPGPEMEQLGKVARETRAYIAGMVYERIPEFPGRFWNTAFIMNNQGEVVSRYRKLSAMTAKTRPGDVLDEYIERYGFEALHPVVDTPLGRLGSMVCYDINFPEIARATALNGAEVILHSTGEGRGAGVVEGGGWEMARRVRAYENIVYLASCNYGRMIDADRPEGHSHGGSEIIDFNGRVMVTAGWGPEETIVTAEIDIEALRRRRASPNVNFLAQLQPHVHLPVYEQATAWPANGWADKPIEAASENAAMGQQVIERMLENGVLIAPEHRAMTDRFGAEASEIAIDRTRA